MTAPARADSCRHMLCGAFICSRLGRQRVIRGPLATAAVTTIGLTSIGLSLVTTAPAGAGVPTALHRFAAPASVHRVAPHPRVNVLDIAGRAKPASLQPA